MIAITEDTEIFLNMYYHLKQTGVNSLFKNYIRPVVPV